MRSRRVVRIETRRPGSQLRNPGWLIFSLPLLSKDARAARHVCVASTNAAAARGERTAGVIWSQSVPLQE